MRTADDQAENDRDYITPTYERDARVSRKSDPSYKGRVLTDYGETVLVAWDNGSVTHVFPHNIRPVRS